MAIALWFRPHPISTVVLLLYGCVFRFPSPPSSKSNRKTMKTYCIYGDLRQTTRTTTAFLTPSIYTTLHTIHNYYYCMPRSSSLRPGSRNMYSIILGRRFLPLSLSWRLMGKFDAALYIYRHIPHPQISTSCIVLYCIYQCCVIVLD